MRHVMEMTVTGAIGIMAIFLVDFLSLFYISRLKDDTLTAGVGYATTVMFLAVSANIGAMIAGSSLVARALGAASRASGGEQLRLRDEARRIASSALVLSVCFAALMAGLLLLIKGPLLDVMGANDASKSVAMRFLNIALPANLLMGAGMMLSGFLRALGDARRAMNVTLFGGLVTAGLDPLLIFGAGLGTDGAAWATVVSRLVFALVGWQGVVRVHGMLRKVSWGEVAHDARRLMAIALPAILTNLATPVGGLLYLKVLASFGPSAVAANAIFDRLIPVAFGVLFALSASVGPILGQNLGASLYDRLRQAMRDSFLFAGSYSILACLILVLARGPITTMFGTSGETALNLMDFCLFGGMAWVFIGMVLISNAAFNNLGFPLYSTLFNWGRATLGTYPFALAGAKLMGVKGAVIGTIFGNALFGIGAVVVVFRAIARLEARHQNT